MNGCGYQGYLSAEHVSVDLDGAKLWSLEFGTLFYGRSIHLLPLSNKGLVICSLEWNYAVYSGKLKASISNLSSGYFLMPTQLFMYAISQICQSSVL